MLDAPVRGKKKRGRQKTRWKDSCKRDMESVGLEEDDARDRAKRKNDIQYHSGDPRLLGKPEEKKSKCYTDLDGVLDVSDTGGNEVHPLLQPGPTHGQHAVQQPLSVSHTSLSISRTRALVSQLQHLLSTGGAMCVH